MGAVAFASGSGSLWRGTQLFEKALVPPPFPHQACNGAQKEVEAHPKQFGSRKLARGLFAYAGQDLRSSFKFTCFIRASFCLSSTGPKLSLVFGRLKLCNHNSFEPWMPASAWARRRHSTCPWCEGLRFSLDSIPEAQPRGSLRGDVAWDPGAEKWDLREPSLLVAAPSHRNRHHPRLPLR